MTTSNTMYRPTASVSSLTMALLPAVLLPHLPQTLARSLQPRGPQSEAVCQTGSQWADDAAQLSPCLVASAVVGGCGTSGYDVPALNQGNIYNTPGLGTQPVNECTCSWAAYNLYSACTACQGLDDSIVTWARYRNNCTSLLSNTTYYPSDVVTLGNTSIPFYATVNPSTWRNAIFDVDQAKNLSGQGFPDVYGAPTTSSTSSSTTSPKSKTNAGAIAGGVIGGVAVLAIGAAIAFWLLRKRKTSTRRKMGPQELDPSVDSAHGHNRSISDLPNAKPAHLTDGSSYNNNSSRVFDSSMSMLSPTPFNPSAPSISLSQFGSHTTTTPQNALSVASRFSSPSPSVQYMMNTGNVDSHVVQPFVIPPNSSTPPPQSHPQAQGGTIPPRKAIVSVYDSPNAPPVNRRHSQDESFDDSPEDLPLMSQAPSAFTRPQRRMNPPAYSEVSSASVSIPGAVGSRDVAANRREQHGTGHRPPLGEKQGSSQDSLWTSSAGSRGVNDSQSFAADQSQSTIDAFMGQMAPGAARPGGLPDSNSQSGPRILHTTAAAPAPARRYTVNSTMEDDESMMIA